jgi:hypothetical protein
MATIGCLAFAAFGMTHGFSYWWIVPAFAVGLLVAGRDVINDHRGKQSA